MNLNTLKKVIIITAFAWAGIFPIVCAAQNTHLPELNVHNVGCYAMVPWPVPGEEVKKGERYDRTKNLNFSVMCIWIRTEEAVEKLDLSELVEQIKFGWSSSPAKTVLVRIDFWASERHKGDMLPLAVYKHRMDAVLKQLEPVMDKLQGITISEENILSDGRPEVLRDLYWHVKQQYPQLFVYQWWTPMTAVPGTYEGFFLPADGWVVDPYYHCKGYYGDAANIKRYIQKYLVTGLPLIFMPYATNYTGFFDPPINEWDVLE